MEALGPLTIRVVNMKEGSCNVRPRSKCYGPYDFESSSASEVSKTMDDIVIERLLKCDDGNFKTQFYEDCMVGNV